MLEFVGDEKGVVGEGGGDRVVAGGGVGSGQVHCCQHPE